VVLLGLISPVIHDALSDDAFPYLTESEGVFFFFFFIKAMMVEVLGPLRRSFEAVGL